MITTFDSLCKRLNLSQDYTSKVQLDALISWCQEHISQDCSFMGPDKDRYIAYMTLAQEYFDTFLPAVSRNISHDDPALNHMNFTQYAAYKGYDRFLARWEAKDSDIELLNTGNNAGMTPLHLAALNGHIHTVNALLARGVLPDKANHNGQFPLYSALVLPIAYEANLKKAKIDIFQLLQAKIPKLLNAVDHAGDTVVHLMASDGFDTLIKKLPEQKAIVFTANNFKKYPIHVAILNQQLQAAQALLAIDGVSKVMDAESRTSLHYAAQYGTKEFAIICYKNGAELEARDDYAMTPLLIAAKYGNLQIVQWLVEQGANIQAVDCRGGTLLHLAVQSQQKKLVSWILDNLQMDVNQEDNQGNPPLSYAQNAIVSGVNIDEMVTLLYNRGANDRGGKTLSS